MIVGVGRLELSLPFANSLKAKRQVVRRVLDRIRAKFNAAAAEVGQNDLWQRASLGVVVVGNRSSHVDAMLGTIFRFIEGLDAAPILDWSTEILPLGDEAPGEAFPEDEGEDEP